MRIGTWNLAGSWSEAHARFLFEQDCDVWLLTEAFEGLEIRGYSKHQTAACMQPGRKWASILSRKPLLGHDDPHPASAFASIGELAFCSTVLPWRTCGHLYPWTVGSLAEKTKVTLERIIDRLPTTGLIWGGDWNHSLAGPQLVGSREGRMHIRAAIDALALQVPTATLEHRESGIFTIDHIAVPATRQVVSAKRIVASVNTERLSDHDAYVVELV